MLEMFCRVVEHTTRKYWTLPGENSIIRFGGNNVNPPTSLIPGGKSMLGMFCRVVEPTTRKGSTLSGKAHYCDFGGNYENNDHSKKICSESVRARCPRPVDLL